MPEPVQAHDKKDPPPAPSSPVQPPIKPLPKEPFKKSEKPSERR
jgi:hypothetical protein